MEAPRRRVYRGVPSPASIYSTGGYRTRLPWFWPGLMITYLLLLLLIYNFVEKLVGGERRRSSKAHTSTIMALPSAVTCRCPVFATKSPGRLVVATLTAWVTVKDQIRFDAVRITSPAGIIGMILRYSAFSAKVRLSGSFPPVQMRWPGVNFIYIFMIRFCCHAPILERNWRENRFLNNNAITTVVSSSLRWHSASKPMNCHR